MKRLLCGSVVLAASFGVVSCNGDPTSEFRNGPSRIVAQPSSVFLDQGTNQDVVVRLEDDQGDPLAGVFELTETGSGITVVQNPDFLGTTVGIPLESEAQFIITAGDSPVASSFTLTAGGLSLEVPVRVMPTGLVAAFSNAAPANNEPVTITAEGYTFLPTAAISFAGDSAFVVSNDGASLTFVPLPGGVSGPALVEGIAIGFLPTTPLSLETTTEFTVPTWPLAGSDAAATAPALPVPAEGGLGRFFDGPLFATTVDHFYKLTVTDAGVYTVTMDWDIGSDVDMFLCPDPGAITGSCDFQAATGDLPEVGVFDLAAGTYFVVAEDFGEDAAGATLHITVQHDPPGAGLRLPRPSVLKVRK